MDHAKKLKRRYYDCARDLDLPETRKMYTSTIVGRRTWLHIHIYVHVWHHNRE